MLASFSHHSFNKFKCMIWVSFPETLSNFLSVHIQCSDAKIPTELRKIRVDSSSSEATAVAVHGIDDGTGGQEPLHDGVAATVRRAMQWRSASGTRREMPIFAAKARWWKLVKERLVFPLQIWVMFYLDVDRKGLCVHMRWFNSTTEQATLSTACHCRINLKHP